MKRTLSIFLTALIVLTPASTAFAKQNNGSKEREKTTIEQQTTEQQTIEQQSTKEQQTTTSTTDQNNRKIKEKKQSFKINGSPVIKYGKYKLPINPISKGMGAKVNFEKTTAVLTITKNDKTIVIDFVKKLVTVNGIADSSSGIFTASNSKKTTVLIKYIAKVLGVRADIKDDEVIVTVPGLDYPTNIRITTDGTVIVANTLNTTTLSLSATATIKAGQATGGKAELYVGNKLVATDAVIAATDTTVDFTTSDGTPTNAELQAAIPTGGVVTVKLYNSSNSAVTSTTGNPTLNVDYVAPLLTGINSVVYSVSGGAITISYTGVAAVGDKIDVTKFSFYDSSLVKSYQLTNTVGTGSYGVISQNNTLVIYLGSTDKAGMVDFGTSDVVLNINSGSLIVDTAGNSTPGFVNVLTVPVTFLP